MAFVFGLQTLQSIDSTKIFQLKGLKSKNNGHMNFYECCDLTKKVYLAQWDHRVYRKKCWWVVTLCNLSCSSNKTQQKMLTRKNGDSRPKNELGESWKKDSRSLFILSLIWRKWSSEPGSELAGSVFEPLDPNDAIFQHNFKILYNWIGIFQVSNNTHTKNN